MAPTRSDFDELAAELIPREWIINRPSIELHKNIVYGQPRINDIIHYVDVNTRSYRDVSIIMRYFDGLSITGPMIDSTVPPSAS